MSPGIGQILDGPGTVNGIIFNNWADPYMAEPPVKYVPHFSPVPANSPRSNAVRCRASLRWDRLLRPEMVEIGIWGLVKTYGTTIEGITIHLSVIFMLFLWCLSNCQCTGFSIASFKCKVLFPIFTQFAVLMVGIGTRFKHWQDGPGLLGLLGLPGGARSLLRRMKTVGPTSLPRRSNPCTCWTHMSWTSRILHAGFRAVYVIYFPAACRMTQISGLKQCGWHNTPIRSARCGALLVVRLAHQSETTKPWNCQVSRKTSWCAGWAAYFWYWKLTRAGPPEIGIGVCSSIPITNKWTNK